LMTSVAWSEAGRGLQQERRRRSGRAFAKDGVLVASDGMFSGRQAIEKSYADTFHRWPITTFSPTSA